MSGKVIVKRGEIVFAEIPVDIISIVDETPDGVVVNLKDKSFLTIVDTFLPAIAKQKIKASIENFKKGEIIVDILNHENPVKVNL
jgi:hypothetical protein